MFPNGPMRPSDGVQRGSVEDLGERGGRPADDRHRLGARRAADADQRIADPHEDSRAADLVRRRAAAAGGDRRPDGAEAWRGALPIPYRLGPGPAKVHLKVAFNWDTKPLYDVIAKIPGSTFPDEWIVRGNHHDALGERRERSGQRHGARAGGGAGARRTAQAGLDAEADDRLRVVGRRGARAARLDRVGRDSI